MFCQEKKTANKQEQRVKFQVGTVLTDFTVCGPGTAT